MTITIRDIQRALQGEGFDPGPVDGVNGRKTIAAIVAFQTREGLKADGIAGAQTLAKLMPDDDAGTIGVGAELPWFAEAQRLIGLREDTTAGSNIQLIQMARDLNIPYGNDEIPWCGLFVGHCVGSQLPREPLPANPLGARNWQKFGREVQPQPGAIMVFWRESMASGKGHVGFYVAETPSGDFLILGGNQGDAVTVAPKPRNRFLGARWPITAMPPLGRAVFADRGGATDQREA